MKKICNMDDNDLTACIEGYAASARRTYLKGGNPTQTLGRIESMIREFKKRKV